MATRFSNGDEVEVSWDDEGFRGAWYDAQVVHTVSRTGRYSVVYDHLLVDDGTADSRRRPLREVADHAHLRPRPPRHGGPFALHQPVDAWHNDGWWTGVVAAAGRGEKGERYMVSFPIPRELREFAAGDLRVHLEWADGGWVRPDENSLGQETLAFPVGTQVEVACRMKDSPLMWVVGIVEKLIWENSLLVRYESFQADAGGELLREIVNVQHVRPCPPLVLCIREFCILEEVEAFHNNGWCAGVVTRVHTGSKYSLKSKHWEGELDFCLSQLRLRHDWIDGCWAQPPRVTYIKSPNPHQKKSVRRSKRSQTTSKASKGHGSVCTPTLGENQDGGKSSDTEMENGPTFEDEIGISLSNRSLKKVDTPEDDALLLDFLVKNRTTKSAVQAGKEYATPVMRERGKSCIVSTLTVRPPSFKKQSKGTIAKCLNFDADSGENVILVGDELEHQSSGQNCYSSSVNHEMEDVHRHLKWAQKCARRPRMNSLTQKRKVGTCPRKGGWNIHRNVVEMGQCTKEKRRCPDNFTEAKVTNSETSLEGDSHGDRGSSTHLADREGNEPSHGGCLLPQFLAVVEADPSPGELATQELLGMTESTRVEKENSEDGMQFVEAVREREDEDLNAPLSSCESHRVVNEEAGVTADCTPCGSPLKFSLPFVKRSSMWKAVEAFEVFCALPQQPHFRPLLRYCSELREGMAIGLMVTFDVLVTNITKLQISDPENMFEGKLMMLSHLEDHGFDVQHVRSRLEKLLRIKHDQGQLKDKKTTLSGLIMKRENGAQTLNNEIEMTDRSVKELEKAIINLHSRRSALLKQRESYDCEIARLQVDEKAATQAILSAKGKFRSALAAAF